MEKRTIEQMTAYVWEKTDPSAKGIQVTDCERSSIDEQLDAELDEMLALAEEQMEAEAGGKQPPEIHPRLITRSPSITGDVRSTAEDRTPEPSQEGQKRNSKASNAAAPRYVFPGDACQRAYPELDNTQIKERLSCLIEQYQDGLSSYAAIRAEFCALSIEMNRRKLMAPRFRPQPKCPRNESARKASDKLASNDRQVIDLHWLKCRGFKNANLRSPYKKLFSDAVFDFGLATEFVTKTGRVSVKADEILHLTRHEQLELAVIQSDAVRREFAILQTGFTDPNSGIRTPARRIAITQRIKTAAHKNPRLRGQIQAYETLWLARELADCHSPKHVREWLGLITGTEPLSRETIRGKLQTLRRILGEIAPLS